MFGMQFKSISQPIDRIAADFFKGNVYALVSLSGAVAFAADDVEHTILYHSSSLFWFSMRNGFSQNIHDHTCFATSVSLKTSRLNSELPF